jgi:two-component system CheB/CheR fusion protein
VTDQAPRAVERRKAAHALRILLVDDERDTVETLKAILEHEGHTVLGLHSGKEVLPAVRMFRPDVVILDIAVPGYSGYALAQMVRFSFTDLRRPLLIAITGMWKEFADRRLAEQVGFDHHLVKPCDPSALLALLPPTGETSG